MASAFFLTTELRRDIQTLGTRLQRAANGEEQSRTKKTSDESRALHTLEIRQIIKDIKKLLIRIEDAVPLINLAITTSGANLSTALPASVSPSRLLQASTFLTAGDAQYSMGPNAPVQVGPGFTLSLYMLFAGHSKQINTETMRDATWKEVIHKARLKLVRVPLVEWDPARSASRLSNAKGQDQSTSSPLPAPENNYQMSSISEEGSSNEFAYQLEIVEDFDDDRVHSFEEGEPQPGPYGDVRLAGIRELLPIYQVSKIFYADTGKILNIGTQGETNNPILLLKRDINATPPRLMMEDRENYDEWQAEPREFYRDESEEESQDDIDRQICRESSVNLAQEPVEHAQCPGSETARLWQLPPGLDPEWLALEVYNEPEEDSTSEDGQDLDDFPASTPARPKCFKESPTEASLAAGLADVKLDPNSSPPLSLPHHQIPGTPLQSSASLPTLPFIPPVRSSLSLLEMLIRLTALQQVHQTSHLAIPDEFLNFFLQESSTTGGDADERRRTRHETRQRVGFDPYDESPIKHHGEDYQYQNQGQGYERGGSPYEYEQGYGDGYQYEGGQSPRWQERDATPQRSPWLLRSREGSNSQRGSPEPWVLRSREAATSQHGSPATSSPIQPYRQPARRPARPLERVLQERGVVKNGSPLGRGMSVETDSTLGTSPGSPTLINRTEKIDIHADGGH